MKQKRWNNLIICKDLCFGVLNLCIKNNGWNAKWKKVTPRPSLITNDPVYPPGVTQVRHTSTQPPVHLTYLPTVWGGRSDKGQGFGCDKEGPCVLLWLWLLPCCPLQEAIQRPGTDHQQWWVWMWPRAGRHTECCCVFTCGIFRPVIETEGRVEFMPDYSSSLTLQKVFLHFQALVLLHPAIFTFCVLCSTSLIVSLCPHLGSCGSQSRWAAWHRVTMSVGKQSLSRMPLSLWQSSSPMKPYQ